MEKHDELRRRLNELIDALIAEGRYQSGDEVIDAIAELLDERDKKIAALIDEGEASGPAEPFDFDDFIARKMKEHQEVSS